jgi:hypothetical protein
MREEINGQVFDTDESRHLAMFCASCDYDGEVENHLYVTPNKIFFIHMTFPPAYAAVLGYSESIEPITNRCELAEFVEAFDEADQKRISQIICDSDGDVFEEKKEKGGAFFSPEQVDGIAGLLLKLVQMEAKVDELQNGAVKKDTGSNGNQRDDEEALDNMGSWDLCEEADQSCSFIKSVLDVLEVSSGKDLFEGTVSALAFKSELEVDRLQRIIDILRTRTRALEKAA